MRDVSFFGFRFMSDRVRLNQVFFEYRAYGKYLRVHAIDPDTGIEAITTGLRSMGREALTRNAKMKLEYVLTRRRNQDPKKRKGWLA